MNKSPKLITVLIMLLAICLGLAGTELLTQNVPARDYNPLGLQETAQLAEMLAEAKLQPEHLSFERDWDLSTYGKSPWHLAALQSPSQGLGQLARLRELSALQASPQGLAELLDHYAFIAWNLPGAMPVYEAARSHYHSRFKAEVKQPKDVFSFYQSSLRELIPGLTDAFADLSTLEMDSLAAFFYGSMIESEDKEKYTDLFESLPSVDDLSPVAINTMFSKLDTSALQKSSLRYLALAQVLAEECSKLNFNNRKVLSKQCEFGLMLIGTANDDIYNAAEIKALRNNLVCLIIDPRGNDVYEMPLRSGKDNKAYLLIDLQGNDVYRSSSPAQMFFSQAGLGISLDLAGDDLYQVDDFSFASFMGTNLHMDSDGNDNYRSGLFSQAAAMQGISVLVDCAGRDCYQATTLGQGMGCLQGVGALADLAGSDLYQLGGKYLHAPLMPNDFRSMGQGMGFGMRPDFAGGLGFLFDKGGNDQYLGGVYAQGVGYWYATGMLVDEAGNDVYNAIYYPQGSGIHLAAGYLYDGGGDDAYYSRNGPGQGAGHDWALGVLIDESGNDAYSIQGGNGLGLSNSVGLFIDKRGDDRYERSEAQNYGNAAFSRSTGGIGLFLDAGGKDSYPDSTKVNNFTWQKGSYGLGRDIELNTAPPVASPEQAGDDPFVASDAAIADVFSAAAEWEVGSAINRVRDARVKLIERSAESQAYILQNKLNSKSGLEYRALEAFFKASPEFKIKLYDYVFDADSLKAKMALSLISTEGDSMLIVPVRRHLQDGKYITACLSLLGSIKSEESVQILSQYAFHSSERYRYIVARSLRQIATPQAYQTLGTMNNDASFLVQALIRNLPEVKP